jgi:thioesterase domain-containing protein
MARQLHAQGQQVGLLALLDASRPGYSRSLAPGLQVANYARRARYHVGQLLWGPDRRDYVTRKYRTVKRRIRERTWHWLYASYKVSGRELPRILRQVRAAHRAALRQYRPRPFSGRVTLFLASERAIELHRTDDLGWAGYASSVDIHRVAGDHVSLVEEPAVGAVAEQLRDCLARARGASLELLPTQEGI